MNKIRQIIFVFIFLNLIIGLSNLIAEEGKISLQAKVDKSKIKIGDLINYSIEVRHDENIEIKMPNLGANLGQFEIRDYHDLEPEKIDGEMVQRREYDISTYDIGDYTIPPVTVHYQPAGDTLWQKLQTEEIKITVESIVASEDGDIRDIKPPLEFERDWMRIARFIFAGFLILVVGILIFFYFKMRKQGKSLIPRREKPKRPPHEIALEELEKLLNGNLIEKGEVKQHYIRISEIVRRYIGDRFFILAIEMTTFDLINAMRESEIEETVIQDVEQFLMQCDLVKFAKYIPTNKENQQVADLAVKIINDTKIVFEPETPESDEQEKIAEDTDKEMESEKTKTGEQVEAEVTQEKEVD